jgi:multisubunit Na+/H+ antiporter MnhE subunit
MMLWLLLTSTINPSEAIVGAGAAAITATVVAIVRSEAPLSFAPRARWLLRAWRVPAQIAADMWTLTRALVLHVTRRRAVRGGYWAIPFRHGAEDDPRQRARRALATVGVTMTPNTYVIGVEGEEDFLFVHQLVSDPESVRTLVGPP